MNEWIVYLAIFLIIVCSVLLILVSTNYINTKKILYGTPTPESTTTNEIFPTFPFQIYYNKLNYVSYIIPGTGDFPGNWSYQFAVAPPLGKPQNFSSSYYSIVTQNNGSISIINILTNRYLSIVNETGPFAFIIPGFLDGSNDVILDSYIKIINVNAELPVSNSQAVKIMFLSNKVTSNPFIYLDETSGLLKFTNEEYASIFILR